MFVISAHDKSPEVVELKRVIYHTLNCYICSKRMFKNRVFQHPANGFENNYDYLFFNTWLPLQNDSTQNYSRQYILGLQYETNQYCANIEGFYKQYPRITEYYSSTFWYPPRAWEIFYWGKSDCDVQGTGLAKGVEVTLLKKKGVVTGWISYHFNKTEYCFHDYLFYNLPFRPFHDRTHELKALSTFSLGSIRFSISGVLASGKPYTIMKKYTDVDFRSEPKNGANLPTYYRVDAQITKRFNKLLFMNWEIGVSFLNIFHQRNFWDWTYEVSGDLVRNETTMLGFTPLLFINTELN